MPELAHLQATVHGLVQGVSFRYFVLRQAERLGLRGYVRNLSSESGVEVYAEGEKAKLEELIKYLKTGPPLARVKRVALDWSEYRSSYSDFTIRY